jgi:hypothetical protein
MINFRKLKEKIEIRDALKGALAVISDIAQFRSTKTLNF